MTAYRGSLVQANGGGDSGQVLWWSLAFGADLGGNVTAVGASANVVTLGLGVTVRTPTSSVSGASCLHGRAASGRSRETRRSE
nr:Na+/H+ antiporter NhaD type [Kibdelosporangium sp. MJ126-NF4]CTQ98988.1 Na+/H+ antiporter NhaD type [Kibdelosporangium sp. MJ126-NF4]